SLLRQAPTSQRLRGDRAASQRAVGQLLGELGRFDEANSMLTTALHESEALAREHPENLRSRLDTGGTHLAQGTLHWRRLRLARANAEWTDGLNRIEAALRDEAEDSPMRGELDNARIEVADKLLRLGLWEEAGALLDRVFRRKPASLDLYGGHYW